MLRDFTVAHLGVCVLSGGAPTPAGTSKFIIVRTKASVRYKQAGRESGVVAKRGSTVFHLISTSPYG